MPSTFDFKHVLNTSVPKTLIMAPSHPIPFLSPHSFSVAMLFAKDCVKTKRGIREKAMQDQKMKMNIKELSNKLHNYLLKQERKKVQRLGSAS